MVTPKISIVVPVYNSEKYLKECLDSCINQTLKEIEIVCVDDASTDNSLKILKESAQRDSRLKIITHQTNKKQGAARNLGVENATGEYVWFVDSDDFVDIRACQTLYEKAKEIDSEVLMFCGLVFKDKKNKKAYLRSDLFQGIEREKKFYPLKKWRELNFYHLNVSPVTYIVKRETLRRFRFREGVWHEDTDFTPILFASVNSIYYTNFTAYHHRIAPNSTTQRAVSRKRVEDLISMIESLDSFILKNEIPKRHFLYKLTEGQTLYVWKMYCKFLNLTPRNGDKIERLHKKYYLNKFEIYRRKIVRDFRKELHWIWEFFFK